MNQVLVCLNYCSETAASTSGCTSVRGWGTQFDSLDAKLIALRGSPTVRCDTPEALQGAVFSVAYLS